MPVSFVLGALVGLAAGWALLTFRVGGIVLRHLPDPEGMRPEDLPPAEVVDLSNDLLSALVPRPLLDGLVRWRGR
jgi:hypothetical protein